MTKTPRPPAGLSPLARRWWKRLQAEYAITDAGGLLLLETALRCLMRAEQAREILDRDGPTTKDARDRPKAHPAAAVERDSRAGMLQALKALHLDVEPLHDRPGRPGE